MSALKPMSALKKIHKLPVNTPDGFNSSSSISAPKSLASFQHNFGQFLRHQQPLSSKTSVAHNPALDVKKESDFTSAATTNSERVTQLYQSLVFNNICNFIDKCFPVCQSLISDVHWQRVSEHFFLAHSCHSPYFTEINQSFVDFLAQDDTQNNTLNELDLPPYFAELAHYEWMELLVDTYPDTEAMPAVAGQRHLNPTLQNLHYQWPVHEININNRSVSKQDCFFLIYRDDAEVKYMQINAVTHALIDFIDTHKQIPTKQLLEDFAYHLGYEAPQVMVDFGLQLLAQLSDQHVLLTT